MISIPTSTNKGKPGFTIVELLIVIVVIAILAAISVVAYNGIQTRARNTQQVSAAKTYLNAFAAYVAANGSYPPTSITRICLGVAQAGCVNNTSWNRDATLDTALQTMISNLPAPSPSTPLVSTPKIGYVPQSDITLDGTPSPFLIYLVEPPGVCDAGRPASGNWPSYSSAVPTQGYTATESNTRHCIIPLPRT